MFTGIIQATGDLLSVESNAGNKTFWVESSISSQLKIDQSVSHNGVCLTVEEIKNGSHRVTAIEETLAKTSLDKWKKGKKVNLETGLKMNDLLDGHLVQGHVDATGICKKILQKDGSVEMEFEFPAAFAALIIEKGSICVDGVSLTAFKVKKKKFTVAIIPYTLEHTTLGSIKEGDVVNLEFDLVGKYIIRSLLLNK